MNVRQLSGGVLAKDLGVVGCPQCGGPARIEWSTVPAGPDELVEHIEIRCLDPDHPGVDSRSRVLLASASQ